MWVCALAGGLLGYAQFPGGPLETDGVVINYQAFGTTGTAQAPFNKGRTATHEVGHYLNLRHIWGDTPDCSGSDIGGRHAQLRRPELRHADVAGDHLQQRAERRHVHELHGLHRRRGDVHVHDAAGAAHADRARDCAQRTDVGCVDRIGIMLAADDWLFSTTWVHVFEEDTARGAVYRPEDGDPFRCRAGRASALRSTRDGSATCSCQVPTTGSSRSQRRGRWRATRWSCDPRGPGAPTCVSSSVHHSGSSSTAARRPTR